MSEITLLEATRTYLSHLKASGKQERTLYTYGKDLEQVMSFFGPEKPIETILLPQVGKFYQSDALLRLPNGKVRAAQTVSKTIRVFRMFMVWAYGQGLISSLPLPKNTPMGRSLDTAINIITRGTGDTA
jgi:hypothetical protein